MSGIAHRQNGELLAAITRPPNGALCDTRASELANRAALYGGKQSLSIEGGGVSVKRGENIGKKHLLSLGTELAALIFRLFAYVYHGSRHI